MNKIKAAFFDRDGTLIENIDYLSSLDQVKLLPRAVELCRLLQSQGYILFVVTNQSGIARGYFDELFVHKTHQLLGGMLLDEGVEVAGWYYCPHHPVAALEERYKKACICRKPGPGMLLQAARDFDIDLTQSLMFGDKQLDLEAGNAAGCSSFDIKQILQWSHEQVAEVFEVAVHDGCVSALHAACSSGNIGTHSGRIAYE